MRAIGLVGTCFFVVLGAGCSGATGGGGDALSPHADAFIEAGEPGESDLPPGGCPGSRPMCFDTCGSDALTGEADCVDGAWRCAKGVTFQQCPDTKCWGGPMIGETCGPNGWECKPASHVFESCPDFICPECTGFDGPRTLDGCTCWCEESDGYVHCAKDPVGDVPPVYDVPGEGVWDVPWSPDVYDVPPDTVYDVPPDVTWDTPYDTPWETGWDTPWETGYDTPWEAGYDTPPWEVGWDVVPDVDWDAPKLPAKLNLDPASLQFFLLPIDSLRGAVAGYDPVANACVVIQWDYSNTGHYLGAHCDDFESMFPYVGVQTNPWTTDCAQFWSYGGVLETTEAAGCVDFAEFAPGGIDYVDVELTAVDPWTGAKVVVTASNRSDFQPRPVALGIRFGSDIPDHAWGQLARPDGKPGWVEVLRDGKPVDAFDGCDVPACGEAAPYCGAGGFRVVDIPNGKYWGTLFVLWDRMIRQKADGTECNVRLPAPAGTYVARMCFGWQTVETDAGTVVVNPTCQDVPFDSTANEAVWTASMGG